MDYEPKLLHVELTDRCNARCPLCARTDKTDISKTANFIKNNDISFEEFSKIVDGIGFKSYTFCGNYGDPLSAKDFLKILEYVADESTLIRVYTNASIKTSLYFKRMGEILSVNPNNVVTFDIDGLEDTHSFYRRNTNFHKIIENAKAYLANTKAQGRWQYLIFDHNKHQVEEAKKMAKELGFHQFRSRLSGWFNETGKTSFYENNIQYTIKKAYSDIKQIELSNIQCVSLRNKEVYLSASKHLWPCCWTASHYRKNDDLKSLVDLYGIDTLDTQKHSIKEIMNSPIWNHIELFHYLRKPKVCNEVCGKKNNRSVNEDVVL